MFLWSHSVSLVTQFAKCVVSFTSLQTFELYYCISDMSRLLAEICRGLDSVFDNKGTCHRHGPVSNPGQGM